MQKKLSFRQRQPLLLRIWHWFQVIAVFGLITTGVIKQNWLSPGANSRIFSELAKTENIALSSDLSRKMAVTVLEPIWNWHFYLVKLSYSIFYLCIFYMCLSGLLMYFRGDVGIDKSFTRPIKEIHEMALWYFIIFIVAHIAGVFFTENSQDGENKGLLSDIVNGGN